MIASWLRLLRGRPARYRSRSWIGGVAALAAVFACSPGGGATAGEAADAPDGRGLAGDYVCRADCRFSDAPPGIDVDGPAAHCRSELGGIFDGQVLSSRSVSCFNMTGTLSADGNRIVWSNGGVWERRR